MISCAYVWNYRHLHGDGSPTVFDLEVMYPFISYLRITYAFVQLQRQSSLAGCIEAEQSSVLQACLCRNRVHW